MVHVCSVENNEILYAERKNKNLPESAEKKALNADVSLSGRLRVNLRVLSQPRGHIRVVSPGNKEHGGVRSPLTLEKTSPTRLVSMED